MTVEAGATGALGKPSVSVSSEWHILFLVYPFLHSDPVFKVATWADSTSVRSTIEARKTVAPMLVSADAVGFRAG